MHCHIYKSSRAADLYLFVGRPEDLDTVDAAIMNRFGPPEFVMTLDLSIDRQLARSDTGTVRRNIEQLGFHLQPPPHAENWAHWDNMKAGIRAGRAEQ